MSLLKLQAIEFQAERVAAILDALLDGRSVDAPGSGEWGIHDLTMLAGACLYLARIHPEMRIHGDHEQREERASAMAGAYGLIVAAVDRGFPVEHAG